MNYKKQYIKLIRKAQNRELPKEVYVEKHHIFPRSIFGKNKVIVKLTAKEHFIAHHLLWKYYNKKYGKKDFRTKKMLHAFALMVWSGKINIKLVAKEYESLKFGYSLLMKEKVGPLNNRFGVKHSDETKEKMMLKALGKKHSKETLAKISLNRTGKHLGHEHWSKNNPNAKNIARNGAKKQMKPVIRTDPTTR